MAKKEVDAREEQEDAVVRVLREAGEPLTVDALAGAARSCIAAGVSTLGTVAGGTYFHAVQAGFKGHMGEWTQLLLDSVRKKAPAPLPVVRATKIEAASRLDDPDLEAFLK